MSGATSQSSAKHHVLGLPQTGAVHIVNTDAVFPKEESQHHCFSHSRFLKNIKFHQTHKYDGIFNSFSILSYLKSDVSLCENSLTFIFEAISINKLKQCSVNNFPLN